MLHFKLNLYITSAGYQIKYLVRNILNWHNLKYKKGNNGFHKNILCYVLIILSFEKSPFPKVCNNTYFIFWKYLNNIRSINLNFKILNKMIIGVIYVTRIMVNLLNNYATSQIWKYHTSYALFKNIVQNFI